MDHAGDVLMKLRPVAFEYREDVVGAQDAKTTQYGLIAEEVAQVAPELVAPDLDGKPYSVKYHELPALLLNELQETERTVEAQRQEIASLRARLEKVEARR
jgi:Chaperone of endosialidase